MFTNYIKHKTSFLERYNQYLPTLKQSPVEFSRIHTWSNTSTIRRLLCTFSYCSVTIYSSIIFLLFSPTIARIQATVRYMMPTCILIVGHAWRRGREESYISMRNTSDDEFIIYYRYIQIFVLMTHSISISSDFNENLFINTHSILLVKFFKACCGIFFTVFEVNTNIMSSFQDVHCWW